MKGYHRVYAKIDLDAVHFNMQSMKEKISKNTKMFAVVKADAYGHGGIEISKEIQPLEYLYGFAVATAEEAFSLAENGITKPILVLGYTFLDSYEESIQKSIRLSVFSYEMAKELSETAVRIGKDALIHIKLDTGMGRIGYQVGEEAADEIAAISKLPGIVVEGMFTHFAKADEKDKTFTHKQIKEYQRMETLLAERGVSIPIKHCANSAAIAEIPEANMDVVRAGITLYGLWPSEEVARDSLAIRPVMQIKSQIVHIKTLEAGKSISYGGTYTLSEPRRIATIPVGYADGYPRSLSNKGYVLIHGKKAPVLGRVCMDQFMVDVTDIPKAKLLDEVTLLGEDEGSFLSMEELGELSGRFNYEFACDIAKRVPRIFYKNNKILSTRDYFCE